MQTPPLSPLQVRVERVGKLHPPADAVAGLRPPHLLLHSNDMRTHRFQAGQTLWLQPPAPPPSPSSPSPSWLLVQAWAHAAVTPGTGRLQLPPLPSLLADAASALPLVQVGDRVEVQALLSPLTPATSLTLTRLGGQQPPSSAAASSFIQPSIDAFISQALVRSCVYAGMALTVELFAARMSFLVQSIQPSPLLLPPPSSSPPPLYSVTASTQVSFATAAASSLANPSTAESLSVDFSSIGGLASELSSIREMVELPLLSPSLFLSFGVRPPRGLLLYGQPGTGKTLIARSIAHASFARFFSLNGADVVSRYVGESEARLRDLFQRAAREAPAVIFIDEVDALCPAREGGGGDPLPKRLVSTLLTLMDGMWDAGRVVVIGATNRPDALDPALRRPGRFDREVEVGVPTEAGRRDILRVLMRGVAAELTEGQGAEVARHTHGYVGADLKALCKEAAMLAIQRHTQDISHAFQGLSLSPSVDAAPTEGLRLTAEDFDKAMALVRPSSMRSVALDIPTTRFEDIGGQRAVKQRLIEAIEWPLSHPQVFTRLGIDPPKGVLLYGPPGCSKVTNAADKETLMAKALACESRRNFIAVKGPELFSKWVGESEKAVREVFRKARAAAPSIVFFDEVDSIAATRDAAHSDAVSTRVLAQLLSELDGLRALKGVAVLAATNRPDLIDAALLRPGRVDRVMLVGPPDRGEAVEVLQVHIGKMEVGEGVEGEWLMGELERVKGVGVVWSGAELSGLCREAGLAAMEEGGGQVERAEQRHFTAAIERMVPRLDEKMMRFYKEYEQAHSLQSI